jgi:hypothetical protein
MLHFNGSQSMILYGFKGPKGQYKSWESTFGAAHEPATHYITLPDAFPEQDNIHAKPCNKARYDSCIEGYDSWFAGLTVAKSLDGTASLKLEPSIYYSGFDPLDYRDGDYSSGWITLTKVRA